ncbi:WXG100 family type VII secretion target [Nocardia sp. NBC_00508]|uniref:WXG100 family type VII secretion target n=1 Tax=Nocardia sp. NBC_00508 TaxID=2975992 RepID=UPI002E81BBA8|nr:WXG100 family type VII secretion target [Nocardia sp. NBC_00508]WUD68602.1 WXG100 family type VII secretion target [Nocardia sp. NBC_00508]
MAGQLEASDEAITKFVNNCRDRHTALQAAITALNTKSDQTTATWSGAARQAFDTFMDSYFAQARKLSDQLDQTSDKLATAGKKFTEQDQAFAQQVASQASSLDLP